MFKIVNAGQNTLKKISGGLPNVSDVIVSWFQPMTFKFLTDNIVDFENEPITVEVRSEGVIQPFTSKDLMAKPEGQRSWSWNMLHCLPDVVLKVGEYVLIDDVKYRVMKCTDYSDYGYLEYDVVEAFTKAPEVQVQG